MGFPGGSDSKEPACSAGDQVRSLGREDPLEEEMATHSGILARENPWLEDPRQATVHGALSYSPKQ